VSLKIDIRESGKGLKELKKYLSQLARVEAETRVGILSEKGGGDPHNNAETNLAELAALHEFGSADGRILERSFLRSTFDAKKGEIPALAKPLVLKWLDGKTTLANVFKTLGAWLATEVKKKVTVEGVEPPNTPLTVARKGSARPLVDTGQLVRAISYVVELRKRKRKAEE
jgi:hypothetical protein